MSFLQSTTFRSKFLDTQIDLFHMIRHLFFLLAHLMSIWCGERKKLKRKPKTIIFGIDAVKVQKEMKIEMKHGEYENS